MLRIGYCWNVLLYCCLCSSAAAQSFNIRVDPHGTAGNASTAWSIEPTTDGRFIAIVAADYYDSTFQTFSSSVVTSILIDEQGTVLSVDRVVDPVHATYPGWSNSTAKRIDGGLVTGGGNFRLDSLDNWVQRPVLFFFTADGAAEGYVELGPDDQEWIGRQAKQTPDGGFVICGETTVDELQSDVFVIKTDAVGNEEWTNTYGGQWNDYCKSIEPRPGGGYFLGGQFRVTSSNRQIWVVALNDTGGVLWDRTWGGEFEDLSAHIVSLADGGILVAGGLGYGTNGPYRRYLAKLDPTNGEFIWQREYAAAEAECVFHVAHEISPNGDIIAGGYGRLNLNYFGTLLRTTSEGDSLWMRNYQYYDDIITNGRGLFRDVIPTPDGGFIACGTALPVTHADTLLYTQDVWVVKTDSMGCIEPGCHVITGVETQITNLKNVLRVWPNPVAAGSAMQVCVELPEGFAVQGQLRLTITDALGRLVQEQNIPSTSGTIPLSLGEGLGVRGIYHLHVSDAQRWISGVSFVVE